MKKSYLLLILFLLIPTASFAQVGANTAIGDLDAKATPVGADRLLVTDSEDSNRSKRSTITQTLIDANIPDNITIDLAAEATALETARTIAGTSFDGTANINISLTGLSDVASATQTSGNLIVSDGVDFDSVTISGDITIDGAGISIIQANSVALGTDTTENYVTSITNGTYITGGDGGSESAALTLDVTVAKDLVTTAPLTGGTDNILPGADADITIAIPQATSGADGYLSSTDWSSFASAATQLTGLSDVGAATQGNGRLLISDGTTFNSQALTGSCTITTNGVITCAGGGASSLTGLSDVGSDTQGAGRLLISDGTNFDSILVSGAVTIDGAGVSAIGANEVGAAEISSSGVAAASYTAPTITVDEDGRITYAASGSLTGLSDVGVATQATGRLLISDGVKFDSIAMSGDTTITSSGVVDISASGVAAASYTSPTITVSADGRLTYAASGSLTGLSDVGSATQGAGRFLISDGAEFDSLAISGDISIDGTGGVTIADSVTVTGWVLGTFSATQLTSPTVITDLIDGDGAVDMDYGSDNITDHTFITDGGTVVIDGTISVGGTGNPGIAFEGETADPCGSEPEGFIFYNSTGHYMCFCDNSGVDLKMNDNSSACF